MVQQLSVQLHATFETHKAIPNNSCTRADMISDFRHMLFMAGEAPNGMWRQASTVQQRMAWRETSRGYSKPLGLLLSVRWPDCLLVQIASSICCGTTR